MSDDVDQVLGWLRSTPASRRNYRGREDGDGNAAAIEVIEGLRAQLEALLAPSRVLRDHEAPPVQVPVVDLVAEGVARFTIEHPEGAAAPVTLRRHADGRLDLVSHGRGTLTLTVEQLAELVSWLVAPER